jgi:hypothetical protein
MNDREDRAKIDAAIAESSRRIKKRAGAQMALIVGPVVLLIAAIRALAPHDYPAGDIRNEPLFWMALFAFFAVVAGALIIGSIRYLLRGEPSDA